MKRNDNGQFVKGNAGGGRPKGSSNRSTSELRERINNLLDNNWNQIQTDLDSLTAKERVDAYIKLLEYSLPKLNRTELATDPNEKKQVVIIEIPDNDR